MSSGEMWMDTIMEDEDFLFVSNTNAIIYGASDISGWTHSLISDNNIPNSSSSTSVDEHHHHNHQQISTAAGDDLMIVSSSSSSSWSKNNKQIDDQKEVRIFNVDFRALCNNMTCSGSEFRGGLLPDTGRTVNEEASSVWLVNTLVACAKATEENNLSLAEVLISDIRRFTFSQIGGAMKKAATYFAEAFYHKIHRLIPKDIAESSNPNGIHVMDFSLNQGSQWPVILHPPPAFQSQPDDSTDPLTEIGFKLAQFAESIGIQIEFCGFKVHTLADLEAPMLNIRPSNVESVAVNSVFKRHPLFSIPGSTEKVRDLIKQIEPDTMNIVKQEPNRNWSFFMNLIDVIWNYYSTMFDLLENSASINPNTLEMVMAEQLLGLEIYDYVANWKGLSSELEAQWNEILLEK